MKNQKLSNGKTLPDKNHFTDKDIDQIQLIMANL